MNHLNQGSLQGKPLHWWLTLSLASAMLLPFVAWTVIGGSMYLSRGRTNADVRLAETAEAVGRQVGEYLRSHESAITSLARGTELMGGLTSIDPWLAEFRAINDDFITLLVADRTGDLMGAEPALTESGDSALALDINVADRDYFRIPMTERRSFVSSGFQGRGFGNDIIVAISAPLTDNFGEPIGIVEGSIALDRFAAFEREYASLPEAEIVIVDQSRQIVYASDRYQPLSTLRDANLLEGIGGSHGDVFVYNLGTSNGEATRYNAVAQSVPPYDWTVIVQQRHDVLLAGALPYMWLEGGLALAGLVIAFLLAYAMSRTVTYPLSQLASVVSRFQIDGDVPRANLSPRAPLEVKQLETGFMDMFDRLRHTLSGLVPICANCKHIRTDKNEWQSVERYISDRSDADFTHSICPRCEDMLYGDEPFDAVR